MAPLLFHLGWLIILIILNIQANHAILISILTYSVYN